jgi:hypothetical protein
MINDGKLSSRPPQIGGRGSDALEAFIGGASVQATEPPAPAPTTPEAAPPLYPWGAPGVRDDVAKVFNLRLPEPYLLKLKHIAEHTPDSMQQFCLSVLLPAIDARIQELTKR